MSQGYLAKCSSRGKPKQSHPTQAEAEKQRTRLIAAGIWTASGSNTYPCNQCGGYHAGRVGRSNRGKGRSIASKNRLRHLDTQ